MKLKIKSKEYEIKKKHVTRALFCGAVGCALVYRSRYKTMLDGFDLLMDQKAQSDMFADELAHHCVNSGIADFKTVDGKSILSFDYNTK